MGLNILVGHTGLVSFGHGAFFGLAAYAAALSQRHWFPGDIVLPALFALGVRRAVRVARRLADPAPARRLFLAADARALRDAVRHRVPLDRADRRRKRAWRRRAPGRAWRRSRSAPWIYYWLVAAIGLAVVVSAVALPSLAGRQRAGRDPRERAARALRRLSDRPLQAVRLHGLGDHHGARRHALGLQSSLRVGRSDLGAVLGRTAGDGGDRRHALLPRACARRIVLHSVSRIPVDLDAELAVVLRPAVRRLHRVLADRPRRRRRAPVCAVPQARDRSRRDGGPRRSRKARRCRPCSRPQAGRRSGADRARACQELRRHPRGRERRHRRGGPHAACADRPERRRQDHGVQSAFRHVRARRGLHHGRRPLGHGPRAGGHHARRCRPLVPDHQPVRRPVGRGEHAPRRAGAQPQALCLVDVGRRPRRRQRRNHGVHGLSRPHRHGARRGGVALLWRAAAARHGARARDRAAHPAARRAARGARGGRAHARCRAGEVDFGAYPGAAGRARHRPRVPDRRRRHRDERRQRAGARQRR